MTVAETSTPQSHPCYLDIFRPHIKIYLFRQTLRARTIVTAQSTRYKFRIEMISSLDGVETLPK